MPDLDTGTDFVDGDDATAESVNQRFQKIEDWANSSIASVIGNSGSPGQFVVIGDDGRPALKTVSGIQMSGGNPVVQEPPGLGFEVYEYSTSYKVPSSPPFERTVISQTPGAGRYLAFVTARIVDSTAAVASGLVHLTKGGSPVASSTVAGDANRSTALPPKELELGPSDSVGVRFDLTGFPDWTLEVHLVLVKLP